MSKSLNISRRQLIGGAAALVGIGAAGYLGSRLLKSGPSPDVKDMTLADFYHEICRPEGVPSASPVTGYVADSVAGSTSGSGLASVTGAVGDEARPLVCDMLDVVRIEFTFVDRNETSEDVKIDDIWGPREIVSVEDGESRLWARAFLTQFTGFGTVYDVGLDDEYVILGVPGRPNGSDLDVTDICVASDNDYAMVFDGFRFDRDTGLIYVAKSNFENGSWYGIRVQLLVRTTLEELCKSHDVPASVTSMIDGVRATDADMAFDGGMEARLMIPAVEPECAGMVSLDDIEVYVSGVSRNLSLSVQRGSIYYDDKTGFVGVNLCGLCVPGIDVVIRRHESEGGGDDGDGLISGLGSIIEPRSAYALFTGPNYVGHMNGNNAAVDFDDSYMQRNARFWPYGYLPYDTWLDRAVGRLFKYEGICLNFASNAASFAPGDGRRVVFDAMHNSFQEYTPYSYTFPVISYMYDYRFAVDYLGLPAWSDTPMGETPVRDIPNIADANAGNMWEVWRYLEIFGRVAGNGRPAGDAWTWDYMEAFWRANPENNWLTAYGRVMTLPGCDVAKDTVRFVDDGSTCGSWNFWSHMKNCGGTNSAVISAAACAHMDNPAFLGVGGVETNEYAGSLYGRVLEVSKHTRDIAGKKVAPYVIIGFVSPLIGMNGGSGQACQTVIKFHLGMPHVTLEKGVTL